MVYALGFAVGVAGLLVGLLGVATVTFVYYKYRKRRADPQNPPVEIFPWIVTTVTLAVMASASIFGGMRWAALDFNWSAYAIGIAAGVALGELVFTLALLNVLRTPSESVWDINLS